MAWRKHQFQNRKPTATAGASPSRFSHLHQGRREDLGNRFFRSRWEANYARYLNWLQAKGQIVSWEYEPKTFTFPDTRGPVNYKPDFRVVLKTGAHEWHEVKGWLDRASKSKLKKMAKHYPGEKVLVIDRAQYKAIEKWGRLIPGWETGEEAEGDSGLVARKAPREAALAKVVMQQGGLFE